MKITLLLTALILLSGCGDKRSDTNTLETKRDSLTHRIRETAPSKVQLQNSSIDVLTSEYTGTTYDIYVSYPPGYQDSLKKYPVLIVLDAEVNFGAVTYIANRLIKDKLIPEVLIIGIAYQGETSEDTYYSLRCRDFTPTTDKRFEGAHKTYSDGSGGADNFIRFLSLELLPYLTTHYRILNDNKTIYGHSFGGLLGVNILRKQAELFNNYLLLSPSLWWDHKTTLKKMMLTPTIDSKQVNVYLGTGSMEGTMVDDQLEMARILQGANTINLLLKSEILSEETHRSVFGRGFTNGLRYLYEHNETRAQLRK
jgi:uncharacterized protein